MKFLGKVTLFVCLFYGLIFLEVANCQTVGGTHHIAFPFGTSAGQTSELRSYELSANGENFFAWKAADLMAASNPYVMPDAYPVSSGLVLSCTTLGVCSWVSASSGFDGSSITFNNGQTIFWEDSVGTPIGVLSLTPGDWLDFGTLANTPGTGNIHFIHEGTVWGKLQLEAGGSGELSLEPPTTKTGLIGSPLNLWRVVQADILRAGSGFTSNQETGQVIIYSGTPPNLLGAALTGTMAGIPAFESVSVSGHWVPASNNTFELGDGLATLRRWKKAWLVDLDFSNEIQGSGTVGMNWMPDGDSTRDLGNTTTQTWRNANVENLRVWTSTDINRIELNSTIASVTQIRINNDASTRRVNLGVDANDGALSLLASSASRNVSLSTISGFVGLAVGGNRVVGPQCSALPADATDLATVITLANATKDCINANNHGLAAGT